MLFVLSGLFPVFLGLGLLLFFPWRKEIATEVLNSFFCAKFLAASFCAGVALYYISVLLFSYLRFSLFIAIILSVVGYTLWFFRERSLFSQLFSLSRAHWIFVGVFLFLYAVKFLLEPVRDWDARSIWFFHAKIMHYAQGLFADSGWQNPAIYFSHPDYPKLLAVLASSSSFLAGYWNESLPKFSLLIFIAPVLLFVSAYLKKSFSFLFLFFGLVLSVGHFLWNGYMDGYFAIFAGISTICIVDFLKTKKIIYLLCSMVFLSMVVGIKSEGALFYLSFCLALVCIALGKRLHYWQSQFRREFIAMLVFWQLPTWALLIWTYHRKQWGLIEHLQLGFNSLPNFIAGIVDRREVPIIAKHLFMDAHLWKLAIIFSGSLMLAKLFKVRIYKEAFFPLFVALIYFVGIFAVYLAAPNNIQDHLASSADRTMMTVIACMFVSSYYVLQEFDREL